MKMKKSLALAMATTLVVSSFAGCGSDEKAANKNAAGSDKKAESVASLGEAIEKGAAITKGNIDGKINVTVKGAELTGDLAESEYAELIGIKDDTLTLGLTYAGETDGKNSSCTVGINVNDKIKADLLEMLAVDSTAYVNVTKLVDGVFGVASDFTGMKADELKAQISLPAGSYLKLTEENIKDLFEGTEYEYAFSGALGNAESAANEEYIKKVEEFGKYAIKLIDEGIKKGDKDAYKENDGTFTLTINKSNINKILTGVVTVASDNSEEFVTKLDDLYKEIAGTSLGIDAETFKTTLESVKNYDVASLMGDYDFSVSISSAYKAGEWTFGVDFSLSEGDQSVAFDFTNVMKENDKVSIEAPTDLISDEDTQSLLSQVKSLLQNTSATENKLNDDYEDYDFEDIGLED